MKSLYANFSLTSPPHTHTHVHAHIVIDLDIKALKLYSPEGPRNGVVITFVTQNAKSLWLAKILEVRERGGREEGGRRERGRACGREGGENVSFWPGIDLQ